MFVVNMTKTAKHRSNYVLLSSKKCFIKADQIISLNGTNDEYGGSGKIGSKLFRV